MTGSTPIHWIVLLGVIMSQLVLLWKARSLSLQDDRTKLTELEAHFASDVHARARRGQAPDWLRYQSEVDRLLEFRDDRLRSLAAAALSVGLGGTLFALFVSIFRNGNTGLDPTTLVQSMGVSLLGSLTGVALNLLIVLVYLPGAEDRFSRLSRNVFQELEAASDEHPPQEAFTQTLREELSLIRQSLNTEFASAFSTAITGFPQVVSALGIHIEKLAAVVEGQGKSIGGAVADLAKCAIAVADSSQRLQPAADKLAEATDVLVRMPHELREVVDETRNSWLTGMRAQHEEHVNQLIDLQQQVEQNAQERERQVLDVTRELQAAVAEVRDAVDRIPDHLATEVGRASGRIGIEFGREARDHTNELAAHLEREYEKLRQHVEKHQQDSLNNVGVIVKELFDQISGHVEERLVGHLQQVTQDLNRVIQLLPEATQRLVQANAELYQSQAECLGDWKEVGRQTGEAARKLAEAEGQLHIASEALGTSASHLERVALITDGFEEALLTSHREVVSEYMKGLDSLRGQLIELLHQMQDGRLKSDGVIEKQSEFIRACIQQLMKGRQVATLSMQG